MTDTALGSTRLNPDQRNAFIASLLGWMMDAFDYFIIVLVYADIGAEFGVPLQQMAYLTTVTLIMRPVGAYLFGLWADRVGRRIPLMADVCFYAIVGFLCAFAPNFTVLFILRLLYGIGMAASGDSAQPSRWRRCRAPVVVCTRASCRPATRPDTSWLRSPSCWFTRSSASTGAGCSRSAILPALITLIIRSRVKESEVWENTREKMRKADTSIRRVFFDGKVLRRFVYLVLLMAAFNWMSHGTQDIYPTFLKSTENGGAGLDAATAGWIAVVYNIGAIVGCIVLGSLSDRWGRKATIILGAALTIPIIPIFAFSQTAGLLCLGSALIQFTTQGAWGAIPAHLNEMSPNAIRGFYPGVTYQLGNVIAAFNLPIQQALAPQLGYGWAMASTVGIAAIAVILLTAFGKQAHGIDFTRADAATPAAEPAVRARR
ncbi:MFS transporter [Leifsonia shinshuensis]|uniref:MFS transporter n=1 Tax=Leifsonia shinshuensis TaxID=150026 RepID=UPI00285A1AA6|nr:MFS transporter [Leifsonia shinshuensis]MDR6973083.1 SHS family lactate transporter-like MFS transporter [Leifsonia shinshuensis]